MKPLSFAPDRSARALLGGLINRLEEISKQSLPAERQQLAALETAMAERERILHRALDEEYFKRELAAGVVTYENGAADAINQNAAVMQVPAPAGAAVMIHRTVGMNALWPRTRPRLTMWYTSPTGAVTTFDLRFQMRLYGAGGNTAPASLFSTTFTPAGPAVANDILVTTIVGGAVVPSIQGPIRIAITRVLTDPNPNTLDILLAVVTFEEIA